VEIVLGRLAPRSSRWTPPRSSASQPRSTRDCARPGWRPRLETRWP